MNAAPQPVREIGQQVVNKLTGNEKGDSLIKLGKTGKDADKPTAEKPAKEAAPGLADLAQLVPQIVHLAEKKLDLEQIKSQSVKDVLALLSQKPGSKEDKATIQRAQEALALLPVLNDLPFEELYLRTTTS